jgi:hypothetical protein
VAAVAPNPNPSRISSALWWLWTDFDAFEPSVQLGGIYAAKGGYHDTRQGAGSGDYSVSEVLADRNGPGDKASAIDLTMPQAGMIKYTTRLRDAAKRRDERLYIGGVPIIREFIGTDNGSRVYCYVLAGGRARGLPADASDDWNRDSSHLWHVHISITRQFCADSGAMSRLASVLRGESVAAWRARVNPAPKPVRKDIDMTNEQIPHGFAFDENENLIDRKFMLSFATEPAGLAGNPAGFADKRLLVGVAGDMTGQDNPPVKVRVAFHNGAGWTVEKVLVKPGGRIPVPVPAPKGDTAFAISVGRMKTAADAPEAEADAPVSIVITVV